MREPTTSRRVAVEVCAQVWPDVDTAREQAAGLAASGWLVRWRWPARLGATERVIVASVHHPETFRSPGDVTYRQPFDQEGGRAWLS